MKRLILMALVLVGSAVGMYSPFAELDEAAQQVLGDEDMVELPDFRDYFSDYDDPDTCVEAQESDQAPVHVESAIEPVLAPASTVPVKRQYARWYRPISKYVCKVCTARWVQRHDLLNHEKRHGSDPSCWICVFCRKHFIDQEALVAHVTILHWFACPLCPQDPPLIFHRRSALKKHLYCTHKKHCASRK